MVSFSPPQSFTSAPFELVQDLLKFLKTQEALTLPPHCVQTVRKLRPERGEMTSSSMCPDLNVLGALQRPEGSGQPSHVARARDKF